MRKFIRRSRKTLFDRSLRLTKDIYQFIKMRKSSNPKTILFIFGCQRSGTTLLAEIFERDFDHTKVYHEFSHLSSEDKKYGIRLNPLHIVKTQIDNSRPPFIVIKPIVESQNALKLLDYFENAKALWAYRHYKDVAVSNLEKWGYKNGINNLRPIIEGQPYNWRSENVSKYTKDIVRKYFSEDMNPYDAAALFWFVRNRLFFEMDLDKKENILTCKYDELIDNPLRTMSNLYKFSGYIYPFSEIPVNVYSESKGRGTNIKLSQEIESLCHNMLSKLESAHKFILQRHSTEFEQMHS
jgi:hypothetical protein